jgi:hypothetical protein
MTMPQGATSVGPPAPGYNGQPGSVAPRRQIQGLSFLIHGLPKAGKSSVADTGPVPRLIVDIEGTSFWTPSRKVYWNPMQEPVPVPDGSWDTCVVLGRDSRTIFEVYRVLNSGAHPFNSVSVDSITEFQQRIIDDLVGFRKVERDHWGQLLRQVSWVTRQWRDLITHPTRPLWSVSFVAGTHLDGKTGKWRPLVQGQVGDFLPYYVDIEGYLGAMPDGSRHLLIGPHPQYETGERVGGRLPYSLPIGYPGRPGYSIESMLGQVLAA